MDAELEKKLHSVIKLKTFINHSINMSNQKLKKQITKMVRSDTSIPIDDKQKIIEYFFELLKKET